AADLRNGRLQRYGDPRFVRCSQFLLPRVARPCQVQPAITVRPETGGAARDRARRKSGGNGMLTARGRPGDTAGPQSRRVLVDNAGVADRTFRGVARSGGLLVLLLMVMIGTFLVYRAWPALRRAGFGFITTQQWSPDGGRFGIAAVIVGTVLIAL